MSNGRNVSSLSEFRFTTTLLVIPMDMDGLHWIPSDEWISMESIGQHFCPPQYLSDFRYSFPSWLPVILLPWEGVTNRILPIPSENQVSIGMHWCVLDMHEGRNKGKFDNHLICFNLYREATKSKDFPTRLRFRDLIHIVQRFPPSKIHTQHYHISVIKKDLDIYIK